MLVKAGADMLMNDTDIPPSEIYRLSDQAKRKEILMEMGAETLFDSDNREEFMRAQWRDNALRRAVLHGRLGVLQLQLSDKWDVVRMLLKAGADVHAVGETPLFNAAGAGHFDTVLVLLENGADLTARNYNAYNRAWWMGRRGAMRLFEELTMRRPIDILMERGWDVVDPVFVFKAELSLYLLLNFNISPSAYHGHTQNVRKHLSDTNDHTIWSQWNFRRTLRHIGMRFIAKNPNIYTPNDRSNHPNFYLLQIALLGRKWYNNDKHNLDLIDFLCVYVCRTNMDGQHHFLARKYLADGEVPVRENTIATAVVYVVKERDYSALKVLLSHASRVDTVLRMSKAILLHHIEKMQFFLDHAAFHPSMCWFSLLAHPSTLKDRNIDLTDCMNVLLQSGADPNYVFSRRADSHWFATLTEPLTPVTILAYQGLTDGLTYILKHGGKVDPIEDNALPNAISPRNTSVARTLIQHGAYHFRASSTAIKEVNPDIVKMVLSSDAPFTERERKKFWWRWIIDGNGSRGWRWEIVDWIFENSVSRRRREGGGNRERLPYVRELDADAGSLATAMTDASRRNLVLSKLAKAE
ncbi:hypothetical protein HK097_000771 [Rhizophlyctis rosea]|uniref:Ankyrin n=1 Tax=Rhizophlyctis rosea TaxID=64517 RepID=A0AAD5X2D6_9FUNG|nr:hypothetical protein HK097_000771 [Rhizophlyctis rosea]